MNTEATLENTAPMTPGQRLRQAREHLGLTQTTVAERLCLKVSTVRQLEDDNTPADLAPTFLRGYIRSYAKLVHIPESELLPVLEKQIIPRIANVASMPSFSLGKPRKKRDGWLMSFTWLVVLVVLGLTGAWWWQNYQVQQQEIHSMVDHAAASAQDLPEDPAGAAVDNASQAIDLSQISPASPVEASVAEGTTVNLNAAATSAPAATNHPPAAAAPVQVAPVNTNSAASSAPTNPVVDASAHAIVMTFSADCWLEVVDAAGKKLFSGMQRGGGELSLNGQAPFRLKIGAPAAVQIQYQGKPVDLSRFVRSNQVARLTLAAE